MGNDFINIMIFCLFLSGCLSNKARLTNEDELNSTDSTTTSEELQRVHQEIETLEELNLFGNIKSGEKKYKVITGIMVGKYHHVRETGNVMIGTHMDFDLGAGLGNRTDCRTAEESSIQNSDEYQYTAKRMLVALHSKTGRGTVLGLPRTTPVVFKYVKSLPYNPFNWIHSKSRFYIYDATRLTCNFEETTSYKKFGDSYNDTSGESRGAADQGFKYGRIVEVSRWGILTKRCTISLHMGRPVSNGQATMMPMNIFSEEGCRYVEDLMISGTPAWFDTSTKYVDFFQGNRRIIHKIWAGALPPTIRKR